MPGTVEIPVHAQAPTIEELIAAPEEPAGDEDDEDG